MDCLIPKTEKQNSTNINYQSNFIKKADQKDMNSMKDSFPKGKQIMQTNELITSPKLLNQNKEKDKDSYAIEQAELVQGDSNNLSTLKSIPFPHVLSDLPKDSKLHLYLSNRNKLNSEEKASLISSQHKKSDAFSVILGKRNECGNKVKHKVKDSMLNKEEILKRINNIRGFWRGSNLYRPIVFVKRKKIFFNNTGEKCIYDYADHSFVHVARR